MAKRGLEFRREVYAFKRFKPYADDLRLIVVPNLTHYGHVESYNERLANIMVQVSKNTFNLTIAGNARISMTEFSDHFQISSEQSKAVKDNGADNLTPMTE